MKIAEELKKIAIGFGVILAYLVPISLFVLLPFITATIPLPGVGYLTGEPLVIGGYVSKAIMSSEYHIWPIVSLEYYLIEGFARFVIIGLVLLIITVSHIVGEDNIQRREDAKKREKFTHLRQKKKN